MWITVCCSGRLGEAGAGGLAVEGWGSRGAGYLLLFRLPLALKLDQSEKSEVLRGSGSGLTTSSIRGRPSPARAQLTMASFSLSVEATGPARLVGGRWGHCRWGTGSQQELCYG